MNQKGLNPCDGEIKCSALAGKIVNLLYSIPQNGVEGYVKDVFKLKAFVLPNSCILNYPSNSSESTTASSRSKSSCSYQIFHLPSIFFCSHYVEA